MEVKDFMPGIKKVLSGEPEEVLPDDFIMDCSSMLLESHLKVPWVMENLTDFCGLSRKEAWYFLAGLKGGHEVGIFEAEQKD